MQAAALLDKTGPTLPRAAVGLAGLALVAVMAATGAEDLVARVAAISALALVLFATRALPEMVTALLCFLGFLAISAAPASVIFSGFSSGGFWLLFSGLIIGSAITSTGLGRQVALRIFARTGTSYTRATLLLAFSGVGLGLLVPSTIPRIIVLLPIAVSLSEAMGYKRGSRGQIGLTITAATSTLLPTYAILTANLPTIVHYGALEAIYGLHPSYGDYFIQQLPVNLVRLVVLLLLLVAYGNEAPALSDKHMASPEPLTGIQRRLLGLLCLAIGFWATDFWHGISPAWVALAVATILLIPASRLMESQAMKTNVDMSPAIFLAGVFAVSAVANHTGLTTHLADAMIPRLGLGQGSALRDLYAMSGFSVIISHLTTAPAAPVLLAPLAGPMAEAAGWSVETVAMAQIIGISTPVFPYEAPPLIVAMGIAYIPMGALLRVCVILAAAVAIIGIPLTYLWWQAIGVL